MFNGSFYVKQLDSGEHGWGVCEIGGSAPVCRGLTRTAARKAARSYNGHR